MRGAECRLQRSRLGGRRPGPGPASRLRPMHLLGACRSTDAQTLGALPLTQSLAPCETPYLLALPHGAPLCRPLLLPLGRARGRIPRVRPAASPLYAPCGVAACPWHRWPRGRGIRGSVHLASVAGLLWHQWPLGRGTGGRLAVASVAGCAWHRWQLGRGIRSIRCQPRGPNSAMTSLPPVCT
jgi:hypothetical protein